MTNYTNIWGEPIRPPHISDLTSSLALFHYAHDNKLFGDIPSQITSTHSAQLFKAISPLVDSYNTSQELSVQRLFNAVAGDVKSNDDVINGFDAAYEGQRDSLRAITVRETIEMLPKNVEEALRVHDNMMRYPNGKYLPAERITVPSAVVTHLDQASNAYDNAQATGVLGFASLAPLKAIIEQSNHTFNDYFATLKRDALAPRNEKPASNASAERESIMQTHLAAYDEAERSYSAADQAMLDSLRQMEAEFAANAAAIDAQRNAMIALWAAQDAESEARRQASKQTQLTTPTYAPSAYTADNMSEPHISAQPPLQGNYIPVDIAFDENGVMIPIGQVNEGGVTAEPTPRVAAIGAISGAAAYSPPPANAVSLAPLPSDLFVAESRAPMLAPEPTNKPRLPEAYIAMKTPKDLTGLPIGGTFSSDDYFVVEVEADTQNYIYEPYTNTSAPPRKKPSQTTQIVPAATLAASTKPPVKTAPSEISVYGQPSTIAPSLGYTVQEQTYTAPIAPIAESPAHSPSALGDNYVNIGAYVFEEVDANTPETSSPPLPALALPTSQSQSLGAT